MALIFQNSNPLRHIMTHANIFTVTCLFRMLHTISQFLQVSLKYATGNNLISVFG